MPVSPNDFIRGLYGKTVAVKLNTGGNIEGTLSALDGNMNLALANCTEQFFGGATRTYADAFVRGNNVLYISSGTSG